MSDSRIIHSVGKRIKNFLKVKIHTKSDTIQTINKNVDNQKGKKSDTRVERWFHENGKVKAECFYRNNQLQGISNYYYESGQVKARENYNEGLLHGMTKRYHPSGQISSEENYDRGKLVSKKEYDQLGNIIS